MKHNHFILSNHSPLAPSIVTPCYIWYWTNWIHTYDVYDLCPGGFFLPSPELGKGGNFAIWHMSPVPSVPRCWNEDFSLNDDDNNNNNNDVDDYSKHATKW